MARRPLFGVCCHRREWCSSLRSVPENGTIQQLKRRHQRIVEFIFSRPTSGNVQWRELEGLFVELGAEIEERAGSRASVFLFGEVRVFHRPHPSPNTDKGAVAAIRKWLEQHGINP